MKSSLLFAFLSRLRGGKLRAYPTGIEGTHKGHPYWDILCAGVILSIFLAPQVSAAPLKSIDPLDSIESSQLADATPPNWAVNDLQSVMERAGIFVDRSPTWEQFAADLDAMKSRSHLLSQADLTTLQRLETEFGTKLAAMRKRVAQLEARGADLESQQFSTTTKLRGQVIMAINAGGFSGERIIAPRGAVVTSDRPNPTSLYRVSLDLDTSFTGKDLLKTRLVSGSDGIADNAGGRLEPNLGSTLDFSIPGRNQVSLGRLYYAFSPQPDLRVTFGSLMAAPDFVDKNRYANASFLDFSTQALVGNFILFPRAVGHIWTLWNGFLPQYHLGRYSSPILDGGNFTQRCFYPQSDRRNCDRATFN